MMIAWSVVAQSFLEAKVDTVLLRGFEQEVNMESDAKRLMWAGLLVKILFVYISSDIVPLLVMSYLFEHAG